MSGIWGKNIKLSIFGESHGKAIGIVIDGLPSGIKLDHEYISKEMKRRAPGRSKTATPRKEGDNYEILSGYFNGRTTGTPLSAAIYNTNQRSRDYEATKSIMRPGHADYTGHVRYSGFNDYRGGGHFSGRLTAPLVFAGAIAKQILSNKNIVIGSHIKSIGDIEDRSFDGVNIEASLLKELTGKEFSVIDPEKGKEMKDYILKIKEEKDSVGGVIEAAVVNLPRGIGSPFFDSVESKLSHLLFSIPAVKGVEFGAGFDITKMKGSSSNDELYIRKEEISAYSNNNGGIVGGITNGMPIIFRVAIKPTPSIGKLQRTVDIEKGINTEIEIEGRHDPCIVPRAVPVIEAVCAVALIDLMMEKGGLI
ncbi:chorismate synthase [Maledivibacter halophilus]|uniref:Chorismate synthase n=1 Tax=Maledivibacter halophilus TaxID=36842 RepID=A0A1T5M099_9FIRM|nr:chorismate synthase [Maledivibacter halophilus]SKC81289.1 chorismate synthase [Maledivibacter halophilus]